MQTSTTLQLRISGTKKRLSSSLIPIELVPALAFGGLFSIVAVMVRLIVVGGSFAVVPLDIPVVTSTVQDKSLASFKEQPSKVLDRTTLSIVLTPNEFLFGDVASFTTLRDDVRSKFVIPHSEGSPQVDTLLSQITAWQEDRTRRLSIRPDKVAILMPDSRIPMNIVIQVINLLKKSGKFENVILGGGLQ